MNTKTPARRGREKRMNTLNVERRTWNAQRRSSEFGVLSSAFDVKFQTSGGKR